MADNEYLRHLSQWVVDHQEEILKYNNKEECDFIEYDSLLQSLIQFQTSLEKF